MRSLGVARFLERRAGQPVLRRSLSTQNDQPLLDHLRDRGLISSVANERELASAIEKGPISLYCGADPTAPSLHVGNMIPLIALLHFYIRGHSVYPLVGGATGEVGDPSGRDSERQLMQAEIRNRNIVSIQRQMKSILNSAKQYAARYGYIIDATKDVEVVNNADWWKSISFLDFLATYGRHIRVSQMIARDSVKNRLSSEQGLGFNEFAYQTLQAYDFWHLFSQKGVTLQIGGNDQWGNITAGIDLISRLKGTLRDSSKDSYGITVPLLTTPSGEKFGKSAGNAVWLDKSLTSPYELYQYFVRVPDSVVEKYLKIFTLIPLSEISEIVENHLKTPELRLAQRRLAQEFTDMVHGEGSGHSASLISSLLFPSNSEPAQHTTPDILEAFKFAGLLKTVKKSDIVGTPWRDVLSAVLEKSKSEAGRLIKGGGVYVGISRRPLKEGSLCLDENDLQDGTLLLIRTGKANYTVIQCI